MLKVTYCWLTVQPKAPEEDLASSLGQGELINEFTHPCCFLRSLSLQPLNTRLVPGFVQFPGVQW